VTIEENGAEEMNLLHSECSIYTKVDPVANIERVSHKQKDDRCEDIV